MAKKITIEERTKMIQKLNTLLESSNDEIRAEALRSGSPDELSNETLKRLINAVDHAEVR